MTRSNLHRRFVPKDSVGTVAVFSALVLSACVPIPPQEERPFKSESLEFLVAGETTKEDVRRHLEVEPYRLTPVTFDDDSVWIYRATRDTWAWLVCGGYAYAAGCAGFDTGRRNYFLSFKFDHADTVIAWEVTTTGSDCTPAGVCADGGELMVLGNEEKDQDAKKLRIPDDRCLLHFYATLPRQAADGALTAWLDEARLGWLVNDKGYFQISVEPGPHTIRTRYLFRQLTQTVEVLCEPKEVLFVHHDVRSEAKGDMRLLIEELAVGRKRLAERRLVLLPDQQPQVGGQILIIDDSTEGQK